MIKSVLTIAAAAIILLLNSCGATFSPNCTEGSGNIISETRDHNKFETLTMDGWGNIYVEFGDVQKIRIETDDDMMSKVTTEVNSGNLTIDLADSNCPTKLNIFLTMTEFNAAILNGSGDIVFENIIEENNLSFRLNGSGNINLAMVEATNIDVRIDGSGNVTADSMSVSNNYNFELYGSGNMNLGFLTGSKVTMHVGGSGDAVAKGNVEESILTLEGSGDIEFINLQSRQAGAFVLGSGDIEVWATDKLNAKISGSGDIMYRGEPEIIRDITGSGNLVKVD